MVVVVSWILIRYVFISWELTSQIDVSLNWVLVRGYLGNHAIDFGLFVLLGLWRLCVRFNRIHQFSFPFNNYCFTIHKRLQYLKFISPHPTPTVAWRQQRLACLGVCIRNLQYGVVFCSIILSHNKLLLSACSFKKEQYTKRIQRKDQFHIIIIMKRVIQKSPCNDLTSLTCTLRRGKELFFKALCNYNNVFLCVRSDWFPYTWCQNPVVGLDTIFDFCLV